MNRSSLPSGLSTLKKWKEEKGTLNFDIKFQRKIGSWGNFQKSMLVYSLLSDSYVPALVFVKNNDIIDANGKSMASYSVLDGLHRLSSLFSYMNDEYKLHSAVPVLEIDGDTYNIGGSLFSELPQELQNLINAYKFSIQVIANASEFELEQLFININSGKELSVIQKAKPKLGVELCDYFTDILSKPFFSQGVNLTISQIRREEDLAIALQSLILLSEDYVSWKSLSLAECFTFSEKLRQDFNQYERDTFCEIADYLGVFDKKAKYLRKNNVCIIVKLAEEMILNGVDAGEFKLFLDDFFEEPSEDYRSFSGVGNVKKVNVLGRYHVLRDECYKHFNLSLDENDDLNNDSTSFGEISKASL
jgi:hypothetical protein